MYQLLRKLADAGAAIVFYSTDYDELIGCCDRVLVLYDGAHPQRARRRGDHRARADRKRAQHRTGEAGETAGGTRVREWRFWLAEHAATLLALAHLRA